MRSWLTVPAALALAVVTACSSGPPSEDLRPTPEPPPSEISPSVPPTPGENFAEVTGTVETGTEQGCLLLDTGETKYVLLGGAREELTPKRRLTVTGVADPQTQTTCTEGVPLTITEIRPAG